MTRMLRGASALLLGLVLLWVGPARASEPDAALEQRALARALRERARSVLAGGDAKQACPIYEESLKLEPALDTRFDLGVCYEALGRLASAYHAFSEVADLAAARGAVELGERSQIRARSVARRFSKLRIIVPAGMAPGVQIERDGVPLDVSEWGLEVPVDAGIRQVRAYGEGLAPWSEQIEVLPGPGTYTVQVPELAAKRLAPRLSLGHGHDEPAEPIDRSFLGPTHRKIAVIAGGVGVACIAVGSVFALRAISKSDASDRAGCFGNVCPTPDGVELRRQAQVAGNVATGSMIGGLTGLATAAALFLLVDGTSSRAAPTVVPRASAHGGEVLWQGRF
jgi:hypothetical protein